MAEQTNDPISPTVKKVLDEYLIAMHADEKIDNDAADRLYTLLIKGKTPKLDEIEAALFPPTKGGKP